MGYVQHWQLADGTPDWSLYPDATHYCPETDSEYESFLKMEDGDLYFVSKHYPTWTEDTSGPTDFSAKHFVAKV